MAAQTTMPFIDPPKVKNGTWTIRNRETGEHRTFRLKTQRDDANFAPGKRVLYLLIGPNNDDWRSYKGVAFIDDQGVLVWKKFVRTSYEALAVMFWNVAIDAPTDKLPGCKTWQERYEFMGSGTCVRCNRKLTHPESIETGIGPECGGRR